MQNVIKPNGTEKERVENYLREATPEDVQSVGCFFIAILMAPVAFLILILFLIVH